MSLQEIFANRLEDVLVPNESVHKDALLQLKQSLDPVAKKYSPLGAIHVDGLKSDQVWVQAQTILESVTAKLNDKLKEYAGSESGSDSDEMSDSEAGEIEVGDYSEISDAEANSDEEDVEEEEVEGADAESAEDEEEEEEEEEEEGAVEGAEKEDNFDLAEFQQHVLQLENEPEEDDDVDIDWNAEVPDDSSDGDLHFNDFFAPPKRTKKAVKKPQEVKEIPSQSEEDEEEEDVLETTRKDLFDSDFDDVEEQNEEQLSRFEKEQRELAAQIEQLENENVGEKEWGMKGEAQAKDRPEESLFNLKFERNAKAAPVITTESTQSLEDLIKERIRKQQFDDIPRRSEESVMRAPKELPELSDQKSEKSLADLYEEDQLRKQNPEYYATQDSKALDAAHQEIIEMFTAVSRKLDALCSWQYTPRPPTQPLSVKTEGRSISMEEAQPGTMSTESQLAPQEVYRSEAAVPMAREEMTVSMKRKRRREKAKAQGAKQANGQPTKKEQMFNALKRGNVTLVDKRGQKRDMRGNEVAEKRQKTAADVKL